MVKIQTEYPKYSFNLYPLSLTKTHTSNYVLFSSFLFNAITLDQVNVTISHDKSAKIATATLLAKIVGMLWPMAIVQMHFICR